MHGGKMEKEHQQYTWLCFFAESLNNENYYNLCMSTKHYIKYRFSLLRLVCNHRFDHCLERE